MKSQAKWILVSAVLLSTSSALAQEAAAGADRFGQQGQLAVSAERMFGIVHSSVTQKDQGDETTASSTQFSLLSTPHSLNGQGTAFGTFYSVPRIGLDYLVIDGLTLGASFGVFTTSGSLTDKPQGGPSTTQDGQTLSGVIIAPRIGYAYMFNDMIGIWPRGGITYVGAGSKDPGPQPDEFGVHLTAVTLEAPLVITPIPHAGFLVAPTFDIGVGGSFSRKDGQSGVTRSIDLTGTEFGLQAGMFLYF